jgi:hypothetical protein
MDQGQRTTSPIVILRLSDANGLGASELEHSVQNTDGDGYLGRLTLVGARAQCAADHLLVAADIRLNQRTPVVAGRLLPPHTAALSNELQMVVALRRRSRGRLAQHRTSNVAVR